MKKQAPGAWLTLSVSYYIAPVCHPLDLLDDASLLLDGARGIAQCLNDTLLEATTIDNAALADAMWGVATLIELGQRNAQEAHKRLCAMRDAGWDGGDAQGNEDI